MRRTARLALGGLLFTMACTRSGGGGGSGGGSGGERQPCRTGNTCDSGFICLSDRCVRPPQADCIVVGNHVASLKLGNYAPVEERQPTIAKYQAACAKVHVTQEQGACLLETRDEWSAATCVPAMFPEIKLTADDCRPVVAKITAMIGEAMNNVADPNMARMRDKLIKALGDSCVQDHWPPAMKACILAAPATGAGMNGCENLVPKDLQQRLTERMGKAMQE